MPMFVQGLAGVNRRLWDGGAQYAHAQDVLYLNVPMSYAAFGARRLPAVLHRQPVREPAGRARGGREPVGGDDARVGDASPPRHGNFTRRASIAARTTTACRARPPTSSPQNDEPAESRDMEIPYTTDVRPDTGLTNPKLGIWLFLASEVMLFGSLFSSYALLRIRRGIVARPVGDPQRAAGDAEHGHPDRLVGHDGAGVGVAQAHDLADVPALHGADAALRRGLPGRQGGRVRRQVLARPAARRRTISSACTSR